MKLRKTFRFRLEPNAGQRQALARMAGARRFIWNWALAEGQAYYRETGKSLPWSELSRRLTVLKQQPETPWLKDADSQALQQALPDLWQANRNFFQKRARFPRFKSKKTDQPRIRIPQRVSGADGRVQAFHRLPFPHRRVCVPKVGSVRVRQSQEVDGATKSATFRQDAAGHWHITLVTEFAMPDTLLPPAALRAVVGVDLGLHDFAVFSDGRREPTPQFFRQQQRKLRRAQRALSRRQKQSQRRLRARGKVARLHRRIANQRNDFLHKMTTELVRDYDGICIEDLNVHGLARTKLAKSVTDASFGEFRRQLEYKTVWNRRHLAVIDRWYPSSKTCHACGAINAALRLADRSWACVCGAQHDRDFNAALNIRSEGLKLMPLAAGYAERINARGARVRPPVEAVGAEARIPRL
jgi:putative transposase